MNYTGYEPLRLADFQTRFLEIEPGSDDPVRCHLRHHSLLRPPEYTALSYCWGDRLATHPIIVNGEKVRVTCGLEPALQQMRKDGVGLLWVDAISINQDDAEEKSYQVSWMDRVFSQATSVIAWLGKSTPGSQSAFKWLAYKSERRPILDWRDGLRDLTNRSYWRRLWVIQEVAKAPSLLVQCGDDRVMWDQLMRALTFIEESLDPQFQVVFSALRHFRTTEQSGPARPNRPKLREALLRSRNSIAKEPRDKVYALLSLTSDGSDVVPFPNYTQRTTQVFTRVGSWIISVEERTSFIVLARRSYPSGLASWVPNWACLGGQLPPWISECLNSSEIVYGRPKMSTRDPEVLRLHGVRLEVVASVMKTPEETRSTELDFPYAAMAERSSTPEFLHVITQLWSALTLSQRHRRYGASGRAFVRPINEFDFFGMVIHCLHPKPGSRLKTWMDLNGEHVLGKRTLVELLDEYRDWYKGTRDPPAREGLMDDVEALIEEGLQSIKAFQMRVVLNAKDDLRLAYQGTRVGDEIYRVQNCRLPLVLRPCKDGYRFVGEVFLSSSGNGLDDITWADAGAVSMHEKVIMEGVVQIH